MSLSRSVPVPEAEKLKYLRECSKACEEATGFEHIKHMKHMKHMKHGCSVLNTSFPGFAGRSQEL